MYRGDPTEREGCRYEDLSRPGGRLFFRPKEPAMVTIEYIVASALDAFACAGTAIARAVLVAVGIDPDEVAGASSGDAPRSKQSNLADDAYSGLEECFLNYGSPMDGR